MRVSPVRYLNAFQFIVLFAVLIFALFYGIKSLKPAQNPTKAAAIENALFTRTEFFSADAIVPFPTEQARNRLAETLQNFPYDSEILLKLAELDEKLGRFAETEMELKSINSINLQVLADFYGRRAEFQKQAEILERILQISPAEKRGEVFSNLIFFAKKHDLKQYLAPEFYRKIIAQDESSFSVLSQYIDKLAEEKNYVEALKILDENTLKFPESSDYFLEKKITILSAEGKIAEALKVYKEAFSPSWNEEESEKFYSFLQFNDNYRAYQIELRRKFKQNPADFQTAVRLIHFNLNEGDEITDIVKNLENARATKKIKWQPEELLTISRSLIESGDGDTASRFLYTLCADFKPEIKPESRRKVLYQLFELLSDAAYERIALTKGNLDFYESVAKSDINPGITTGILSLIFADSAPQDKFDESRKTAVKLFNRAAAYRIFEEFKTNYADAPELAQMYLDITRLYTNSNDLEVADKSLTEFETKYQSFKDFPDAALKLADAYIASKKFDKEREIYQKLLDFLGKSEKRKFRSVFSENKEPSQEKPAIPAYPPNSNEGIDVTNTKKSDSYYYYETPKNYKNFLDSGSPEIIYEDVLSRFVGSLARENKTQEILNLYAAESEKYPNEEALYEQMLQWLGQTNLVEKQLEVYQKVLNNFQQKSWKDKFARWLIRNKRDAEFENFSRSVIETFDDHETQQYLSQFIDGKESRSASEYESKLFFALYSFAHKRFPHNLAFVRGLLRYYKQNKLETDWRNLLAEYYFESPEIRQEFLTDLSKNGEIRSFLAKSVELSATNGIESTPYKLFRADASVWLSDFEKSVVFYRELNDLYPSNPQFSENFLEIARSFGQTNRNLLNESATFAQNQAENFPAEELFRTRAGEIQAELGDYEKARQNWEKIVLLADGESESYLNTATVFWDYFQFADALKTIQTLREKRNDKNLYAFQAGAILEAQNNKSAAISEYLKALEYNETQADKWRAKNRLKQLYRSPEFATQIDKEFKNAIKNAENPFRLVFNFSDAMFQMNRRPEAVKILLARVEVEKSTENLLEAKQFFRDLDEQNAVRQTLERLIKIAENPRDSIFFRLQLAEKYRENFQPSKSEAVIADLLKNFPANYGVLKETEHFYWDSGEREKSVAILQTARKRARGDYLYQIDRQLAQRFVSLNRADQAENILVKLQNENPNDDEVFSELTDFYIRTKKPESLRKSLAKNLDALRDQKLEPREFTWRAKDLRENMIKAFTRLKDHDSAAEQYIEIINRDPDDEENVEAAIGFVKRYGGAEKLREYYKKVASESFKNYRWNLVLAQIYEAENDLPNAAENYKVAIFDQPEMIEIYESLGEVYLKMRNYQAALENVEKMLELSNEDKKYIKQKVQILEKLGRLEEANAEKAKLPVEDLPKPKTLPEQFAEAQNQYSVDQQQAIELYRQAFEKLTQNPFQTTIKSADIAGFVQTVHTQDALENITEKLWILRENLSAEITKADSLNSGKARENLRILDSAMIDSISLEIKSKATGNEIIQFREGIENRLASTEKSDFQKLLLLENLIAKCGFADLQEKLLLNKLQNFVDSESESQTLKSLIEIYRKRSDYRQILQILETNLAERPLDFIKIYATNARILQETEKEKSALQLIFVKQDSDDDYTRRYLEIFYEQNRAALENLTLNSQNHQLQIINFLFAKNEPDLANEAIKNSKFSSLWKLTRAAETNLQFSRTSAENEALFVNSLQIKPIGELVRQNTDERKQLIGKDWLKFSVQYGKWLFAASQKEKAENYLPAGIEELPKSADEQFYLGFFYLQNEEYSRALEHLQIAAEIRGSDKEFLPYIGAAFYKLDAKNKAFEIWSKIFAEENPAAEDLSLYLKTLCEFGQAEKARNDLKPSLIKQLKNTKKDSNNENLLSLFQILEKTFADESEKYRYFTEICKSAPRDSVLPRMIIENSLVERKFHGEFYKIIIERADGLSDYEHDYDYVNALEEGWDKDDAELLHDAENDFQITEPKNDKLDWQQKYLSFLIENRDFSGAAKLIFGIEDSLKGQYARPVWLRLADFRVKLSKNQSASVLTKMRRFSGIEILTETQKAVLPDLERFNQSVEALQSENRADLIFALREAFYARLIALGQFTSPNFSGLIRNEFEKGDSANALQLLNLMTNFDAEESETQLLSLPLIAKFADTKNLSYEKENGLYARVSLKFAAEIAAEFGFLNESASYREKLRDISPDDSVNKIELARLYQKVKSPNESAKILTGILSDKNAERSIRWKSLIVLADIIGKDEILWRRILDENAEFEQIDTEIWIALNAFYLYQTQNSDPAIKLLQENDFTLQLKFLKAVFEKNSGFDEQALADFCSISEADTEIYETFGFYENSPQFQIINLYLKNGKTRAALDSAKKINLTNQQTSENLRTDFKFVTLEIRARKNNFLEVKKLLENLSLAAETIGEFRDALAFENAKTKFLNSPDATKESAQWIETLNKKLELQNAAPTNSFTVNEKDLF